MGRAALGLLLACLAASSAGAADFRYRVTDSSGQTFYGEINGLPDSGTGLPSSLTVRYLDHEVANLSTSVFTRGQGFTVDGGRIVSADYTDKFGVPTQVGFNGSDAGVGFPFGDGVGASTYVSISGPAVYAEVGAAPEPGAWALFAVGLVALALTPVLRRRLAASLRPFWSDGRATG